MAIPRPKFFWREDEARCYFDQLRILLVEDSSFQQLYIAHLLKQLLKAVLARWIRERKGRSLKLVPQGGDPATSG